jgi:vancomycin permeability regulator SanA
VVCAVVRGVVCVARCCVLVVVLCCVLGCVLVAITKAVSDAALTLLSRYRCFGLYPWGVPTPRPEVSPKRWLSGLSWLLAGGSILALAAVACSVRFVRSKAAGHLYGEADVPALPVGLVLGAQVKPDGTPSGFLAARLDLAKRLYDAGRIGTIIVSGNHSAAEYNEPAAMLNYLTKAGVPAEGVITDPRGYDTYQSCLRARQIYGLSQLIMVTQGYHLPRAVATCRALGIDAIGVGDDSVRQYRVSWWRGTIRDQLACVKTIVDLATRRDITIPAQHTAAADVSWRTPSLDQA